MAEFVSVAQARKMSGMRIVNVWLRKQAVRYV